MDKYVDKTIYHFDFSYFIHFTIGFVLILNGKVASGVYLDHSSVIIPNGAVKLNEGFSISFRACAVGSLLRQDGLMLSLIAGDTVDHAHLRLNWNYNNGSANHSVELKTLYSVDSNIRCYVNLIKNNSGLIFRLSSDESYLGKQELVINSTYLQDLTSAGNLTLGSNQFSGCIYGTEIVSTPNSCPLETLTPCQGIVCPAGFIGRYCHTNINECDTSSEKCHKFSICKDLVDDFKCICGQQWTGRLCDVFLGSPCDNVTCQNEGTCKETSDRNNYTCTCKGREFTGRHCEIPYFPCMESPCENGGVCFNSSIDSFNCTCKPGFVGSHCEIEFNDCAHGPCKNGICVDIGQNFTCNCTGSGFYGDFCQNDINECKDMPCHNGTCKNLYGRYECNCNAGLTGRNCEVDINDCESKPCMNGGRCIDMVNGYNCSCTPGFEGNNCSTNINECNLGLCVNSVSCQDKDNDYSCTCQPGYTGKNCDINIDECESDPCLNNGTCADLLSNFTCSCSAGYTGYRCETNIDDCVLNKCQNNGTCVDGPNNYNCTCVTGFSGRNCEINIDDCDPNPCMNYGTCKDQVNNYTCNCIPSYTGRRCETYQDPCLPLNPCLNGATCRNDSQQGYTCDCTPDFGGSNCEFKLGACFPNNPCMHGKCNETNGTYNCTCEVGYTGQNCSKNINECLTVSCNFGFCVDTDGSYYCNCSDTGYEGKACKNDIDECVKNNPCLNSATCINKDMNTTGKKFECDCKPGFLGEFCEIFIPYCAVYEHNNKEKYCKNEGKCIELGGLNIECDCIAGYNGLRCENDINECLLLTPCQNNATCYDLVNDYNCSCIPGFSGRNCSNDINECANPSDPCMNNATCLNLQNHYKCECQLGYNGTNCENDIDWCESSPCKNGADCFDGIKTHTCKCLPGFTGTNCSVDIKDCDPNPCMHVDVENTTVYSICIERSNLTAMLAYNFSVNATSFRDRDGYICKCIDGLEGGNCSTDIRDCANTSCPINATCIDLVNNFKCVCPKGMTGEKCDVMITECDSNPCQHNGTCLNILDSYKCNCSSSYTGQNCETALDLCIANKPCQNNATCNYDGSSYSCSCLHGFHGQVCDKVTTVNFHRNGYWLLQPNITSNKNSFSLRFTTTYGNGILIDLSDSRNHSLIAYMNGGITYISFNQSVYNISSATYNDGAWHTLTVRIDNELQASIDDVTIHVNSLNMDVISRIYVGGSSMGSNGEAFIGCIQDVMINNHTILPQHEGLKVNVTLGTCNKPDVCSSNPCNGRGECIDHWSQKTCKCMRQYFGDNCENEISSFNFQRKPTNGTRSRRAVVSASAVADASFSFTHTQAFSFLMRTRQSNAFIALLVSSDTGDFTYVSYTLKGGKLNVNKGSKNNGSQFWYELPTSQNDGTWHEIIHASDYLSDNNHSYEFPIGDTQAAKVYLGDQNLLQMNDSKMDAFEGCLQAVKAGNKVLTNQNVPGTATSNISLSDVATGCNGSDVCGQNPCLYDGKCNDLWNAFNCTCNTGFAGKTCSLFGCAIGHSCPSDCIDIPTEPGNTKCTSPLTYNGYNSSTSVKLQNVTTTTRLSFSIKTRQKDTLVFVRFISQNDYLACGITNNGEINIRGKKDGQPISITGTILNDGAWHKIDVEQSVISIDNVNKTANDSIKLLSLLKSNDSLIIGAHNISLPQPYTNMYLGCIKNIVIGDTIIPLDNAISTFTKVGCVSNNPCTTSSPCFAGTCKDTFNDFECICPSDYTMKTCNETINVTCAFQAKQLCNNSATCVNLTEPITRRFSDHGLDYFRCDCKQGYKGYYCNEETNECLPDPCVNNATCVDQKLDYTCQCTTGWEGKNCSDNINDCNSSSCHNNGICIDELNGFHCNCNNTGYRGSDCSQDINECTEIVGLCRNGGNCSNVAGSFNCSCVMGYFGKMCEHNNTQLCAIQAPCINNGSCKSNMTGFYCDCSTGYTGDTCSIDINECLVEKPCVNGDCFDSHSGGTHIGIGYTCKCSTGYEGVTCASPVTKDDDGDNLALIIGVSLAAVVIIIIIIVFLCVKFCRDKSGMEGTYSPNKEEQQVGNVEMNTLKKPNTERLI